MGINELGETTTIPVQSNSSGNVAQGVVDVRDASIEKADIGRERKSPTAVYYLAHF
ncbi:MAG: hypothetical protein MZU95_00675 [Desulfomicrobium escambiense]|nr:hypothetical protein [Desulfomicrobium escambiense]